MSNKILLMNSDQLAVPKGLLYFGVEQVIDAYY